MPSLLSEPLSKTANRAAILVTGGAGYIGSHACKLLSRTGFQPVVFDNLSTGWARAVKFGPLVQGDLLDRAALDTAFAQHKPIAVISCFHRPARPMATRAAWFLMNTMCSVRSTLMAPRNSPSKPCCTTLAQVTGSTR